MEEHIAVESTMLECLDEHYIGENMIAKALYTWLLELFKSR
jgi:hypothetical protein